MKLLKKFDLTLIALIIIIFSGGFFRYFNLNWDQGYFFNPDESNNIAVPAANLKPPYKPNNFTYGSLTIYLYRAGAELTSFFTHNRKWLNAEHINIVGRFISATISTGLIFLIYYLGKKLYSKKVGLLAAFLTSFNVGLIQAAHFGTTETIITFGGVLTTIAAIHVLNNQKYLFGYLLAGFGLGIAIGAKLSALVFAPPFFLSHLLSLSRKKFFKRTVYLFLTGIILLILFSITCPYALLDFKSFKDSFLLQQRIATGKMSTFYTTQFRQALPYVFQIKKIFPYILGLPVFFLGILGFFYVGYQNIKNFNKKQLLFIFIPAFYFLYNGSLFVKWTRYMVPLAPFFCLLAAIFLIKLHQKTKLLANFLIILTVFLQFFYTLGFFNIYKNPDTRIQASEWIYINIPRGATLLLEPLDVVSLPLPLKNYPSLFYKQIWFDFYSLDNNPKSEKLDRLTSDLVQTDFIIIGSRRIYGNRLKLKNEFPLTAKYYQLLMEEQLGFVKIKEFYFYPGIGKFKVIDDLAEETFQVFDHPKILIFENKANYSPKFLESLLK